MAVTDTGDWLKVEFIVETEAVSCGGRLAAGRRLNGRWQDLLVAWCSCGRQVHRRSTTQELINALEAITTLEIRVKKKH